VSCSILAEFSPRPRTGSVAADVTFADHSDILRAGAIVTRRLNLGLAAVLIAVVALPGVAAAAPTGSIAGKVTASAGGSPIAGIEVCAIGDQPGEIEACAVTASSGEYAIGALPDGSYEVFFFSPAGSGLNYIGSSYPHAVIVANGADTPHIDAALAKKGATT